MTEQVDTGRVAAALPGYELGGELGRGGFGAVLAGRHRLIDRIVAVKVLLDPGGTSGASGAAGASGADDLRARFLAEARVLAGLDHPHVVRIYDYVECDGLCLLVMEQLTGGSLRRRSRLSTGPAQVGAIGVAAAVALAAAHGRGVLHRDVKPDNLLFTGDGVPKVTDFGIAKIVEATAATTTGLVGTPRYMAPEQITGGRLGPGTDLYSLAVVLYELFARRSPFPPDLPVAALLHHHLSVAPLPLTEAPGPVADVIASAMAKEPSWRPASALDFAVRLAAAMTATLGPGWLAASGIPVRLPDDVLSAAGHHPTTPRPAAAPLSGTAPLSGSPPHPHGDAAADLHRTGAPARGGQGRRRARGGGRRRLVVISVAAVGALAVAAGLLVGLGAFGGGDGDRRPAYAGAPVTLAGLSDAGGLTLGADGSLYLTDPGVGTGQGQVVRLTSAGRADRIGGSGPRPTPTGDAPSPSPSPSPVIGDGGPSLAADLQDPAGVAVGRDGAVYLAERDAGRIRRIGRDRVITTVAGAGPDYADGFTADVGDATKAHLDDPSAVAVDDDGVLYVAEGYRVRRVEKGRITTVAGKATEYGSAGDGGPAVNATLYQPSGLALGDDGSLYVADRGEDTVRRIDRSGRITLVAGRPGTYGNRGDGRAATAALLDDPTGLALGPDGSLYIADAGNDVIRRVDGHGIITTVAGTASYSAGDHDGALATQTRLSDPAGVAVDPTGTVYLACSDGTVRRVGRDGFMTTALRPPA
ncbi:serine/threonine-protein kinase [Frankia sp. AvcI1]|uniref:serine/threonine-protein kinase n=1 Tax=Frankia sp. AvcI1 TaxID=573496 RepID=UPI0021175C8E|nr:serine/threonine-protein kinase [Frankia sp. AvcI1]